MKAVKSLPIAINLILLSALCLCTGPLNGMNIGRRREESLVQQGLSKKVWVKTADKVISLPKWEIDQMKALQMLYVAQKGDNSETNPIDISTITIDELGPDGKTMIRTAITSDKMALVKMALKKAINAEIFENYCENLAPKDKNDLINVTFSLQAMGLAALLANEFFPPEVQEKLGAIYPNLTGANILGHVIEYLKNMPPVPTILHGHSNNVNAAAFNPDGTKIASGSKSNQNNLILWDAFTHQPIYNLVGHQAAVACLAFSHDGTKIVSGSQDKQNNLIVWDVITGKQICNLVGHEEMITAVEFSPDDTTIASSSYDKQNNLIIWNSTTGEQIHNIATPPCYGSLAIAFSPDGTKLITGLLFTSGGPNLIMWDTITGRQIYNLVGNHGRMTSVAFSPDGTKIVSGSAGNENNLIVWDALTGQEIYNLVEHKEGVDVVKFNIDGSQIASGGYYLATFDSSTGQKLQVFLGHPFSIYSIAFNSDSTKIASGSETEKNNLIIWDNTTGKLLHNLAGHPGGVHSVTFSPDNSMLLSASDGTQNNLILWSFPDSLLQQKSNELFTLAQARFLYRLYIAKLNAITVQLTLNDPDYAIYKGLPNDIKTLIKTYFLLQLPAPIKQTSYARTKKSIKAPQKVEESASFTKAVQEKTEYYRTFFNKVSSKSIDEKIAIIKQTMSNLDKNSVDYKACQNVLDELELEPF